MKRVRQSDTRYIPPVRLYWEDVEELAKLVAPDGDVKVVSGDFEYESLEELNRVNAGRSFSFLQISRRGGTGVSVNIERASVRVSSFDPDSPAFSQVVMFLGDRSPWYLWSSQSGWWHLLCYLCCMTMVVLGVAVFGLDDSGRGHNGYEFNILAAPLGFLPALLVGRTRLVIGSKIFTVRSTEALSFWERNRDHLIRDGFVGTIGATVGYLLTKLFG